VSPNKYVVQPSKIKEFREKGYAILENVLSEEEVQEIEAIYARFMNRDIKVPGKVLKNPHSYISLYHTLRIYLFLLRNK
jgi:hypothetical protein